LQAGAALEHAFYASTERRPDGAQLDRESGALNGPSLELVAQEGSWRLQVEGHALFGAADYEGQTQIGTPLASRSSLRHAQAALSAAHGIGPLPIFAGALVQWRDLDRTIQSTPLTQELEERLRQLECGPVLAAAWRSSFGTRVLAQAALLWAVRSTLDVDFKGTFDPGHLDLPTSAAQSGRLQIAQRIGPAVEAMLQLDGQRFTPAASAMAPLTVNGVPMGAYGYPGSTQVQWSVSAGIRVIYPAGGAG
jgi:hypothetical protein